MTFTYDALGRRISKRFRGRVTRWVWDGDQPLHEWQELEIGPGSGAVQDLTTWLFEDDSFAPMAKLQASGAQSVVCDHLGTPLALYDAQGSVSWEAELDSYGAVHRGRGAAQACPFRYQGQYEDTETGLYYNRFRYFDPEVGLYISQDPIGLADVEALHGYVADPLTQLDVLGLSEGSGDLGRRMAAAGHTHGIIALDDQGNPLLKKGATYFPKSDFRAHHVIPHQVWVDNQKFFDDIGLNHVRRKVNPKDAVTNGVFLPGTEDVGRKYGFDQYHSGGHPATSDAMRLQVENVRDRFNDPTNPLTAAQARKEIAALQKAERQRLSSRRGVACTIMP
ncbi:RHS repeat-associated core domain-containing protein [Hymenobacter sp. 5116S-27]|uniref:RHS domain-containing protein n=1 Tax=Hymenobacter cellulosivorans TaxID=2932249 RepID=A0ABY4FHX1_9BACT|nr:RHS domain-containing protein [Hymenobacter cellulosivorans]